MTAITTTQIADAINSDTGCQEQGIHATVTRSGLVEVSQYTGSSRKRAKFRGHVTVSTLEYSGQRCAEDAVAAALQSLQAPVEADEPADLPHDVPAADLQTVLIRDAAHSGTLVTRLPDGDGFVFVDLEARPRRTEIAPRCVLVELAPPTLDEEAERSEAEWSDYLPTNAPHGVDLEGPGYALIGLAVVQDLDDRIGVVLWDSADE